MERDLTLMEQRKLAETFGVVIFILDDDNNVFVVQETEDDPKTGKTSGQCGVICKKASYFGQSWAANMQDALMYEAMIPDDQVNELIDFPKGEPDGKWEMQFVDKVWAVVLVLRTHQPEHFMEVVKSRIPIEDGSRRKDVKHLGFFSREDFEKMNLREGVRNIIDKYGNDIFNHKK